uniref:Uncharacterized protein n=1 Tax=Anguilla anguilla TaxID=7936 RepID=A0A0E9Q2K7_ANGAN
MGWRELCSGSPQ